MSKLNRIYIKGFKSIKEADIKLKDINILIGANASGKSNFIQFLRMLHFIVEKNFQLYVGKQSRKADSLLYYSRKITKEIEGKLIFGPNQYIFRLEPTEANSLIFAYETAVYHPNNEDCSFISKKEGKGLYVTDHTLDFEVFAQEETSLDKKIQSKWSKSSLSISSYVRLAMFNWIVYHFHDTGDSSIIKQTNDINDNKRLKPDASNLAAVLYRLKNENIEYYEKIINTIKLVNPFFNDFVLEPNWQNGKSIDLEWTDKNYQQTFNAYAMSDGTLRFICLATLLMQPNIPETIIIDEPELGLHPAAINILASLIKSASKESQIIISTQSVNLINNFNPEDIIVVERKENYSTFTRLEREPLDIWLEDYSLGEIWEKNIIKGRP